MVNSSYLPSKNHTEGIIDPYVPKKRMRSPCSQTKDKDITACKTNKETYTVLMSLNYYVLWIPIISAYHIFFNGKQ